MDQVHCASAAVDQTCILLEWAERQIGRVRKDARCWMEAMLRKGHLSLAAAMSYAVAPSTLCYERYSLLLNDSRDV